jgi:hypothetical protein
LLVHCTHAIAGNAIQIKADNAKEERSGVNHRLFVSHPAATLRRCAHSHTCMPCARAQIDTGVSLAEALASQYVEVDAPLVAPGNLLTGQYVQTVRGRHKPIQLFGEEKIRLRQQVRVIACDARNACARH